MWLEELWLKTYSFRSDSSGIGNWLSTTVLEAKESVSITVQLYILVNLIHFINIRVFKCLKCLSLDSVRMLMRKEELCRKQKVI